MHFWHGLDLRAGFELNVVGDRVRAIERDFFDLSDHWRATERRGDFDRVADLYIVRLVVDVGVEFAVGFELDLDVLAGH